MSENSAVFRSEFAAQLMGRIPQDQISAVLSALDAVLPGYEIRRSQVAIINSDGSVPEVVKFFIASKAVANLSMGTLKIYRLRLVDFFSRVRKPFTEVTANDVRMYLYYYKTERNASDHYLDSIRKTINIFYSWLVTNDYPVKNPCATIEHIKYQEAERHPLSAYELEVLRFACRDIREKALVDFLFSTGCRVAECQAADLTDIDWHNRSVVIRHGKGDKRRTVFFNAEAELTLRKYLDSRTDDSPALFVSSRRPHSRLSIKAIENIIRQVSARCDMHVYPHMLRHTFATSGLRSGMPLEKLQALMGHAEPRTTLIYAKQSVDDLQREHMRVYS